MTSSEASSSSFVLFSMDWESLYKTAPLLLVAGWGTLFFAPPAALFRRPSAVLAASALCFYYLLVVVDQNAAEDGGSFEDFKSVEKLTRMLSKPVPAFGAAMHFFSMDLVVGQAVAYDFFSTYNVNPLLRVVFFFNFLLCLVFAPIGFLLYLLLREILYKTHKKVEALPFLPESHYEVLQKKLTDAIPQRYPFLAKLPEPVKMLVYAVAGATSTVFLLGMLALYFAFSLVCVLLWTATFHWPLEGTAGKNLPLKAVVIWSGRFRAWWLSVRAHFLVELIRKGWPVTALFDATVLLLWIYPAALPSFIVFYWREMGVVMHILNFGILLTRAIFCLLPVVVQFGVFLEFVPFATDPSTYFDALVDEFGPVVPFGDGVCFTSHAHCKAIMESPKLRKGPLSFGWNVSDTLYRFSDNTTIFYPQIELQRSIVLEGRRIVRTWIKEVVPMLADEQMQEQLKRMLPFRPADGSMIDATLIEKSFGSIFFHLLTVGEMKKAEIDKYGMLVSPVLRISPFHALGSFSGT